MKNSPLLSISARILLFLAALIFMLINFSVLNAAEENTIKRFIVGNGQLFSESSSYDETFLDKNNNKIVKPTGIIGQVTKGQGIQTIHRIRFSRMQVTLDDGRKGWVDIQLVSPSPEKDAFLLHGVKLGELMKSPGSADPAVTINSTNKNTKFKRRTPLRVLEWQHQEEKNKNRVFQSGKWWAKVEIEGYSGWIEGSRFRFKNQMFDSAIPAIWYPIHWISNLLGDGFFAGLFILFLMVVPMTFGYFIARAISTKLKFLPNFILYLIILIIALPIYLYTFMSVYDASTFNRGDILMLNLYGLLVFFTAAGSFAYIRKNVYYRRCPGCRLWKGKQYDSKKLSESITTTKTTWHYSDGSQKSEVNTTTIESWKDSCCCENCGYCWAIHRIETNKT